MSKTSPYLKNSIHFKIFLAGSLKIQESLQENVGRMNSHLSSSEMLVRNYF